MANCHWTGKWFYVRGMELTREWSGLCSMAPNPEASVSLNSPIMHIFGSHLNMNQQLWEWNQEIFVLTYFLGVCDAQLCFRNSELKGYTIKYVWTMIHLQEVSMFWYYKATSQWHVVINNMSFMRTNTFLAPSLLSFTESA